MSEVIHIQTFQDWFTNLYVKLANEEHSADYADRLLQNSTMLIKFIDAQHISIDHWFNESDGTHLGGHLPNFPSLKLNLVLDESDGYDKEHFAMSALTLVPNTFTPDDIKEYIKAQCIWTDMELFDVDDFLTRRTLVLNIHRGVRHYDFENILFPKRPPEDYWKIVRRIEDTKSQKSFVNRHCEEIKALLSEEVNGCSES